jgi:hypothetical protein
MCLEYQVAIEGWDRTSQSSSETEVSPNPWIKPSSSNITLIAWGLSTPFKTVTCRWSVHLASSSIHVGTMEGGTTKQG